YLLAFDRLAALGDYVTINVSSPNTPGLRQLQSRTALEALLGALSQRNQALAAPRPLFVKVAPDQSPIQLDQIVEAVFTAGISGIIASNTTLARAGLRSAARGESGGLSGQPLTARARSTIRHLHRATEGKLPIIGVGGVASAEDAYGHLRAGASLVQIYTALVYQGPGLVKTLKRDLAARLRRDGVRHLSDIIGQ
ncbi:MAG: dihydroorotate dehydrogenase (quinone), partial [Roseiflexaceae bacterium]|nr:dihydroorotate dehydrogenase (quinone) [Roseiflexaceae bacterium]